MTVDFRDEAVGLTVEDDGEGRPEDLRHLLEAARTGSPDERHGLVNMRERAELVGGVMSIAESELGGVAITVVAPRVDGLDRRPAR